MLSVGTGSFTCIGSSGRCLVSIEQPLKVADRIPTLPGLLKLCPHKGRVDSLAQLASDKWAWLSVNSRLKMRP
jgi:hypothetical protein